MSVNQVQATYGREDLEGLQATLRSKIVEFKELDEALVPLYQKLNNYKESAEASLKEFGKKLKAIDPKLAHETRYPEGASKVYKAFLYCLYKVRKFAFKIFFNQELTTNRTTFEKFISMKSFYEAHQALILEEARKIKDAQQEIAQKIVEIRNRPVAAIRSAAFIKTEIAAKEGLLEELREAHAPQKADLETRIIETNRELSLIRSQPRHGDEARVAELRNRLEAFISALEQLAQIEKKHLEEIANLRIEARRADAQGVVPIITN